MGTASGSLGETMIAPKRVWVEVYEGVALDVRGSENSMRALSSHASTVREYALVESAPKREIVGYVVRDGKVRGKGRYDVALADDFAYCRWGERSAAFDWGRYGKIAAAEHAALFGGRVVAITRKVKP